MEIKDLILKEVEKVPEQDLPEILDFIRLVEAKKSGEKKGILLACESSLKKDWLLPEEDEAWQDL